MNVRIAFMEKESAVEFGPDDEIDRSQIRVHASIFLGHLSSLDIPRKFHGSFRLQEWKDHFQERAGYDPYPDADGDEMCFFALT